MKLRIALTLLFLAILSGISACAFLNNPNLHENSASDTVSVGWLLKNPQFDQETVLWGKVSGIGEMYCPCFYIESGGATIEVWYDLMTNSQGKSFPKADLRSIKNGDTIVIRGELVPEQAAENAVAFWLKEVKKIEISDESPMIISSAACQKECLEMGLLEGQCKELETVPTTEIKIGICSVAESGNCTSEKNCGCFCQSQNDYNLTAAPPAAVFLLGQIQLKSSIRFPSAQAIEMRYLKKDGDESSTRWLKAAATSIAGNTETLASLETAFEQLGIAQFNVNDPTPGLEDVSFYKRENVICMIIKHRLGESDGNIEIQCGILEPDA